MIKNSYFYDLELVDAMLENVSSYKDRSSEIHEVISHLEKCREEFGKQFYSGNPGDESYDSAYSKMTEAFLAVEQKTMSFIQEYQNSFNRRIKVLSIFFNIADKNTGLINFSRFDSNVVSVEMISTINRLRGECRKISFTLTDEEYDTIKVLEGYVE